jgi:hypothetical protein
MVQGRFLREPDRMVRAAAGHPAMWREQSVPRFSIAFTGGKATSGKATSFAELAELCP